MRMELFHDPIACIQMLVYRMVCPACHKEINVQMCRDDRQISQSDYEHYMLSAVEDRLRLLSKRNTELTQQLQAMVEAKDNATELQRLARNAEVLVSVATRAFDRMGK